METIPEQQGSSAFHPTDDNESPVNAALEREKEEERKKLAHKESIIIGYVRLGVFAVLLTVAAIVSGSVYLNTRSAQIRDFEHAYEAHAFKIVETFETTVARKLEAVDALSVTYTAYAQDVGATFPNVTLSSINERACNTRVTADSGVINYYPIVTDETRAGWEEYTRLHSAYYNETIEIGARLRAIQDEKYGYVAPEGDRDLESTEEMKGNDPTVPPYIYELNPETGEAEPSKPGSGPFLPLWQTSPAIPLQSVLNFNVLSHPDRDVVDYVIRNSKAALGKPDFLDENSVGRTVLFFRLLFSMGQYRYGYEKVLTDPKSSLSYPVFDSLDPVNRTIAAVLSLNIYWGKYFENILPANARGIIAVVDTNCFEEPLSFRLDGDDSVFIGPGDKHDPIYDHLVFLGNITKYIDERDSPETSSYTSVDLSDHCEYTLRVYPSSDTEGVYRDNQPFLFALVTLCCFIFTSVVFVSYDYLVARRQRIVMNRAVASSAIVSSLYPSQVRDKIYEEVQQQGTGKDKKESWVSKDIQSSDSKDPSTQRPIAQVYENTTILFMDMAGFTKWSSSRRPDQVFELLEAVYSAFDAIALRRKVFKIETIGDCYVAVAGLPEKQEDHAVIMAKFARDCMEKMEVLTLELVDKLGEDTADLKMRVGMHSGSVTGGVLRGQKARFQLFGDTMNTASRMGEYSHFTCGHEVSQYLESTGLKGRIQVSEATADELRQKGKEGWLTPREEKVVAKGKGEMQTYWVRPVAATSNSLTSSFVSALSD